MLHAIAFIGVHFAKFYIVLGGLAFCRFLDQFGNSGAMAGVKGRTFFDDHLWSGTQSMRILKQQWQTERHGQAE